MPDRGNSPDNPCGFRWQVLASENDGPGERSRHGLAYHAADKATVLFGGIVWRNWFWLQLKRDTWEFRRGEWKRISRWNGPPARHRGAMVYDDQHDRIVLFGGQGSLNNFLNDTWFYSNQTWQCWKPRGKRPPGRCGHAMAYDSSANVLVMTGGVTSDDRSLNDTWLFDGEEWHKQPGQSPRRRYASAAYHPTQKACLLHGGADDETGARMYGDEWVFQSGQWRASEPFRTPARDDHTIAYHHEAGRMVMLGGLRSEQGLLTRESTGWKFQEIRSCHPSHQCSPMVWDQSLNGLVLHGGEAGHGGSQFDATRLLKYESG